jgi:hypothetical protein
MSIGRGMSGDAGQKPDWGRRVAIGLSLAFALLVAGGGLALILDDCDNCGADSEAFAAGMGYAALFLGGLASALALWGRPALALLPTSLGMIAIVAAFLEAMSHLR